MHIVSGTTTKASEKYKASSSCTPTFFFLHPHNFLNPETRLNLLFEKGRLPEIGICGVCYGFINPELNFFFFRMRGCSGSNFCINYWFPNCWIRTPNSVKDSWIQNAFFWITDFWIWNAYFCYGLEDPECFFWMLDFLMWNVYFELQIGGSKILPEVSIWNFSRFHNP